MIWDYASITSLCSLSHHFRYCIQGQKVTDIRYLAVWWSVFGRAHRGSTVGLLLLQRFRAGTSDSESWNLSRAYASVWQSTTACFTTCLYRHKISGSEYGVPSPRILIHLETIQFQAMELKYKPVSELVCCWVLVWWILIYKFAVLIHWWVEVIHADRTTKSLTVQKQDKLSVK